MSDLQEEQERDRIRAEILDEVQAWRRELRRSLRWWTILALLPLLVVLVAFVLMVARTLQTSP